MLQELAAVTRTSAQFCGYSPELTEMGAPPKAATSERTESGYMALLDARDGV